MRKKTALHLFLFILFLLSFSTLADRTYVGIHLYVRASRNAAGTGRGTDHERFIADFEKLIPALKSKGINTIAFAMNWLSYRYQCDPKLAAVKYPANGGFTADEVKKLAEIVRDNGMKIIITSKSLTHMENNAALGAAYPEYMVKEGAWKPKVTYIARSGLVEHKGQTYQCKESHVSNNNKEPGTKTGAAYWRLKNRATRNPFDPNGEKMMFKMIDELIAAFTVDGKKPEAFHIECDEGYSWLKIDLNDPRNVKNLNYAQTFAMAINNLYKHIKDTHPDMDVMMWSDMLDPITNGRKYRTSDAVDFISKDIIIVDWRYNFSWYRYDFKTGLFPSVKELTDKGFKVITSSWKEVEPTKALIWTGNLAAGKGGTILGHIYTTWCATVPGLKSALDNPAAANVRQRIIDVAESINASYKLIGLKQCAQTDTSYGSYPDCANCNDLDGFYGTEYRDYFLGKSGPEYKVVALPLDPVSYWDFEENANDRGGHNNGELKTGASIVNDPQRGKVLNLDGVNDYAAVKNNARLGMRKTFTISFWFKLNKPIPGIADRMTLLSKDRSEYEITAYPRGKLKTMSSNGKPGKTEPGVSSWNPMRTWKTGKWYHAAWVMNGKEGCLYVDGELIGAETRKKYSGTLPGSHELDIGRKSGGGYYFNGRMDDVVMFDRVLVPAEVKLLYLTQKKDPSTYARMLKKH